MEVYGRGIYTYIYIYIGYTHEKVLSMKVHGTPARCSAAPCTWVSLDPPIRNPTNYIQTMKKPFKLSFKNLALCLELIKNNAQLCQRLDGMLIEMENVDVWVCQRP